MTAEFSDAQLADCVRAHLDAGTAPLRFEHIATGKFNTSHFVADGDRQWVLRIAPPDDAVFLFYERGMMRQEPEVHALLRERTEVPVARIIAFDDSRARIDRDYLLMERLPGRPLNEAQGVDQAAVLRQVGRHLAAVHGLVGEAYGYTGAHRPMPAGATWAEAFRTMWTLLLEDIAGVGLYGAATCRALERLLEDHFSLFDRAVKARLLHMDIWAQNLLVDDAGTVTGLVDWDRALWGDPEIEFAVLDYCGISEPAFWEGYGKPRDLSMDARRRQIFYLLYELQKYIVIRKGRDGDEAAAQQYRQQALHIVRHAFGVSVPE